MIKLAESEEARGIVNLGSGVARSIDDVLAILKTELEGLQVKELPFGDPLEASCADMSLFKQVTGWMPGTSLEEGIRQIIAYEKEGRAP